MYGEVNIAYALRDTERNGRMPSISRNRSGLSVVATKVKYPSRQPSAIGPSIWDTLRRPLHLSAVAPGALCPVSLRRKIIPEYAAQLGDGPVYVDVDPVGPFRRIDPRLGGYHFAVPFRTPPDFTGPFLVRSRQLDGSTAVRFFSLDPLVTELELLDELRFGALGATPAVDSTTPSGWQQQHGGVLVIAPGCYAFQIDGLEFSEVIVFQLTPPQGKGTPGEA